MGKGRGPGGYGNRRLEDQYLFRIKRSNAMLTPNARPFDSDGFEMEGSEGIVCKCERVIGQAVFLIS